MNRTFASCRVLCGPSIGCVAAIALAACSDDLSADSSCFEPRSPSPSVRLGLDESEPFAPLAGDELLIEYGAQGGQHVFLASEMVFSGSEPWILDIKVLDQERVVGGVVRFVDACASGGTRLDNLIVFLDRDRVFPEVTLRAELRRTEDSLFEARHLSTAAIVRRR